MTFSDCKFPTVLRLLFITQSARVVSDNIWVLLIRYTDPVFRFISFITLIFPDTYSSLSICVFPNTFSETKFPTVFRLL